MTVFEKLWNYIIPALILGTMVYISNIVTDLKIDQTAIKGELNTLSIQVEIFKKATHDRYTKQDSIRDLNLVHDELKEIKGRLRVLEKR